MLHVIENQNEYKGAEAILQEHKFKVRDILINHLDHKYHSKVVHLDDPVEILNTLKEIKRCETNVTSFTVRKEISNME